MKKQKIVVLTGAGVSAESGIQTFRDAGGLWEGHDVMDVATPEAWYRNPALVLKFYNQRRRDAGKAKPNAGHKFLAKLEEHFDLTVVTQNVDDLHERAGSSRVIHLHGELAKARSSVDDRVVYELNHPDIEIGDMCECGSQLRPHIVWFGERVPMMGVAIEEACRADIFIVVGTSLQVYPAAGLLDYVKDGAPIYVVDPNTPALPPREEIHLVPHGGSLGMKKVFDHLVLGKPLANSSVTLEADRKAG